MTDTPSPTRSAQPPSTALRLSIEDEARTLRLHLSHGSNWLLDQFRARVQTLGDMHPPGGAQLPRLQHLVESAAQATGLVFETAQNAAAVVASSDAAYRRLHFQLLPLASYFRPLDARHPSRLFCNVFYWLIRRALEAGPATDLLVRRRRVDQAYWEVAAGDPLLMERLRADPSARDSDDEERNLVLCVKLFSALMRARPVHDGDVLPWATERELPPEARRAVLASLLVAVVTVGMGVGAGAHCAAMDASQRLQLALLLVDAQLKSFEEALAKADADEALANELAFLFRHV